MNVNHITYYSRCHLPHKNKPINDNLEQQAQALFKAWFVDFEPFKGEKFVESQLGMIPEGWKFRAAGTGLAQ